MKYCAIIHVWVSTQIELVTKRRMYLVKGVSNGTYMPCKICGYFISHSSSFLLLFPLGLGQTFGQFWPFRIPQIWSDLPKSIKNQLLAWFWVDFTPYMSIWTKREMRLNLGQIGPNLDQFFEFLSTENLDVLNFRQNLTKIIKISLKYIKFEFILS